jgi:hypothetical protein
MTVKKSIHLFLCFLVVFFTNGDFVLAQAKLRSKLNEKLKTIETQLKSRQSSSKKLQVLEEGLSDVESFYKSHLGEMDQTLMVDLVALKSVALPTILSLRKAGLDNCGAVKGQYLNEFNADGSSELQRWEARAWSWLVDICDS